MNMPFFKTTLIVIATLVLCSCASSPKVVYKTISSSDDVGDSQDVYNLKESALEIEMTAAKSKLADGEEIIVESFNIVSTPKSSQDNRIGIKGFKNEFSTTNISLTKFENTDIIKSIGVETVDDRVASITKYGEAIVKVISLAAVFGAAGDTPCFNETTGKLTFDLKPASANAETKNYSVMNNECITVNYKAVPVSVVPKSAMPTAETEYYFYSACREAEVVIRQSSSKTVRKVIRFSDPNYMDRVAFPKKGKITHHSQCGVSVVTEEATVASTADVIGALETQGKAIKEALEAAK